MEYNSCNYGIRCFISKSLKVKLSIFALAFNFSEILTFENCDIENLVVVIEYNIRNDAIRWRYQRLAIKAILGTFVLALEISKIPNFTFLTLNI